MFGDSLRISLPAIVRTFDRCSFHINRNRSRHSLIHASSHVCPAHEKIDEGKEHQQHATNARRLLTQYILIGPMFHMIQLANLATEHYHKLT